ncbi:hypothetical protein [Carboxylicivirga taeanensis]|uniref:hypothetical protein n=1 Tax=Carboxylicivirga taeanensis TaxID=1416875 RepID=UPI003F6E0002
MRNYVSFELKLLSSRKSVITYLILFILLISLAFIYLWSGTNDQLSGAELAGFVTGRTMGATLTGLFFAMWIIQIVSHLLHTGYYRSLLIIGISRTNLFHYGQFQIGFYLLLFLLISFASTAIAGLFYGIWPWHFIRELNYNSLLAFTLYLYALGNIGLLLSFSKASNLMALPFFLYWLIELWLVSYGNRAFDTELFHLAPLSSIRHIIGSAIMTPLQILSIVFYSLIFAFLFQRTFQKKAF